MQVCFPYTTDARDDHMLLTYGFLPAHAPGATPKLLLMGGCMVVQWYIHTYAPPALRSTLRPIGKPLMAW